MMNSLSLNNPRKVAFFALVIVSVLFALSRMPGGIGGTGISGAPGGIGGTGIYGRIDAFGSIWVNGVEIFYEEDQNVIRQGRDGLPERLSIGQIVAVVIDEQTGRAEAKSIEIIEEVSGLIEQLSVGEFIILGQKIILTDETIMDTNLVNGKQVAINGLRSNDGIIVASRISSPLIAGEFSLRGSIDRVDDNSFWVGDQEILRGDKTVIVGNDVELRGRLDHRRVFVAEQFEAGEDTLFDDAILKRNYQTIVQKINDFDFDDYDINQIQVTDHSIATVDIEFERLNNDIAIKNKKLLDFKPLIREKIIEARIAPRKNIQQAKTKIDASAVDRNRVPKLPIADNALLEIEARRKEEIVERREARQLDQRKLEKIAARRQEIQKNELVAANTRRLAAIAARRQAIEQARQQLKGQAKPEPRAAFSAQELDKILRDSNINVKVYQQIQKNIRDRVQGEIRDGARMEVRLEVRKRIREEIRRRIRRQLRDRQ
ncbi:MAG: hypothetical protein JKY84_07035 [Emcibacteraceae bacterium]|nr:hypothetical protein [Emcibacteraceae bacterium]